MRSLARGLGTPSVRTLSSKATARTPSNAVCHTRSETCARRSPAHVVHRWCASPVTSSAFLLTAVVVIHRRSTHVDRQRELDAKPLTYYRNRQSSSSHPRC